jgi:hypothetical protein
MRLFLVTTLVLCPISASAQAGDADERELRRLHSEVIRAHVENLPDLWLSIESADYVSVNGGTVTFPSLEERRVQRTPYLENATFLRYHDLRAPIVRVSADGSLGCLIAEVEVAGTLALGDGSSEEFDQIWAWIELYQRTPDGWKLVGNVSNRRGS